jgi:hypothetical protein
MSAVEQARQILNSFGSFTPTRIFAYLEAEGMHGCLGSSEKCVLANYLRKATGAQTVTVFSQTSVIDGHRIENPRSVRGFVNLFDALVFPSLITGMLEMWAKRKAEQELYERTCFKVTPQMRRYLAPWLIGEAPVKSVPDCIPDEFVEELELV